MVSLTGASALTPTSATVSATINPQNVDTTYHFEYGTTTGYGTSVPVPDADIGSGDSDVQVTQNLTGLAPNTTYHYRVVATSSAGLTDGPDQTFTSTPPALINVQPPTGMSGGTGLSTGNATLNVYLDPQGADTSYHFDYGTTTGYGSSTPAADAGSGNAPTSGSAQISGLAANTTYHYRTVVSNSYGSYTGPDSTFTTPPSSCPNQQYRTGASTTLPDCRAYEQVSPQDKAGYPVSLLDLAPAGDRVAFGSSGAFAGEPSEFGGADYMGVRNSSGWSTQPLDPPAALGLGEFGAEIASSDLTTTGTVLYNGRSPVDSSAETVYLRNPDGSSTAGSPTLSPTGGGDFTQSSDASVVGGDSSMSHLVLTSEGSLLPHRHRIEQHPASV